MDGALGEFLARKTEERVNYRILGWFENGFRHISNRLRPIHLPADMKGMKIRVLPSEIHRRTFELLGAVADAHGPDRSDRHDQGRHAGRAGKSARQYGDLWRAQVSQVPHADQSFLYFTADLPASPVLRQLARKTSNARCRRRSAKRSPFSASSPSKSTNNRARRSRPKAAKSTRSRRANMTPLSPPCSRFLPMPARRYGDAMFEDGAEAIG